MHKLAYFTCIIVLLVSCGGQVSDEEFARIVKENCDPDVNQFLLEQLKSNRVVMLSDSHHGSSLYMQGVIKALNHWLDQVEESQSPIDNIPRHLLLILERDSRDVENLKRFFQSGDISDYFIEPPVADQFTTSHLEYYSDLRDFWQRVAAHNAVASPQTRVAFDIFGPEKTIETTDWTLAKRDSFFFYERDEYLSSQIVSQLESKPDFKALIFYGAAHLSKTRTLKHGGEANAEGYYLGHYLNERYADSGGFRTIQQASADDSVAAIWRAPESSYGFDMRNMPPSFERKDRHAGYDGLIYHGRTPPLPEIDQLGCDRHT